MGQSWKIVLQVPEKSGGIKENWGAAAGSLPASVAEGVMGTDIASIGSMEVAETLEDEWLWRW